MSIGNAVQRGSTVYVYDPHGKQLFAKPGALHGFTSATVVIRLNTSLVTYNEKGRQIAVTPAR